MKNTKDKFNEIIREYYAELDAAYKTYMHAALKTTLPNHMKTASAWVSEVNVKISTAEEIYRSIFNEEPIH